MNRYYIDYPRDFANEYTIFVVDSHAAAQDVRAAFPDALQVSRDNAVERGWRRPRAARRDGEQWFGGFAEPQSGPSWDQPRTPSEAIELAKRGTTDRIAQLTTLYASNCATDDFYDH